MRRFAQSPRANGQIRRWLWALHEVPCYNPDEPGATLKHIQQNASQDKVWDMDFSIFEQRHPFARVSDDKLLDSFFHCCSTELSGSARSLEQLSVTVSSLRVAKVVTHFLSTTRPVALQRLDVTLHDNAFVNGESSLASLLRSASGFATRLKCLRIAIVARSTQHGALWSRQQGAVAALMDLVSVSTLESLSLEYVDFQGMSGEETAALCDAVGRCSGLKHLSFRGTSDHFVRTLLLRDGLREMKQLTVLDMSSTCLGDVSLQRLLKGLKASIGGWHRLEVLSVVECQLSAWVLRLMYEDVADPELLPPGVVANLRVLNLSSNGIDDEGAFTLASCCMLCGRLQELHLRHNRISEKGVAAIGSALSQSQSLRVLSLHSNPLKDSGLKEVLESARHWPALQRLDLTRCRLTVQSMPVICKAIKLLNSLQELVLDRNDFRLVEGGAPSSSGDDSDHAHIHAQDNADIPLFAYDRNYMHPGAGNAGMLKVPTSFELDRRDALEGRIRYKGTEAFTQTGEPKPSHFGEAPFQELGTSLSACQELRHLSLSGCSLTDVALVPFAGACSLRGLKHLDMSGNPLFNHMKGLEALASLLSNSSGSLEVLDLSFTALGSVGVSLLADGAPGDPSSCVPALCSLKQLKEFRLSHCHIGEDGLSALTDALPSVQKLERLFLDGNQVNDPAAVIALLGSLSTLQSLTFVSLHGTFPSAMTNQVTTSHEYVTLCQRGVILYH
ncbi:hypothetical protein TRVL_05903 [Trypanosoma vivax]|nr:hypothetical protein TRVL_05903 [Trypanosoma vivax]